MSDDEFENELLLTTMSAEINNDKVKRESISVVGNYNVEYIIPDYYKSLNEISMRN